MAPSATFSVSEIDQTIDLNCKAPAVLINLCLPFMEKCAFSRYGSSRKSSEKGVERC